MIVPINISISVSLSVSISSICLFLPELHIVKNQQKWPFLAGLHVTVPSPSPGHSQHREKICSTLYKSSESWNLCISYGDHLSQAEIYLSFKTGKSWIWTLWFVSQSLASHQIAKISANYCKLISLEISQPGLYCMLNSETQLKYQESVLDARPLLLGLKQLFSACCPTYIWSTKHSFRSGFFDHQITSGIGMPCPEEPRAVLLCILLHPALQGQLFLLVSPVISAVKPTCAPFGRSDTWYSRNAAC